MKKIQVTLTSLVGLLFLLLAACTQAPAPQATPEEDTLNASLNAQGLGWLAQTLDGAGNVGEYSSMVLNSLGNPVISYYDGTPNTSDPSRYYGSLKLMVCGTPTCSSGNTITTVDAATIYSKHVGEYGSLALDSRGFPVVSYFDWGNGLMLVRCRDVTCTSKTIRKVNSATNIIDTSLVLDSSGYPVIAFTMESFSTNGRRVASSLIRCGNADCYSTIKTVMSIEAGEHVSLAMNRSDAPVISYYESIRGDLMVVNCDRSRDCSTKSVQIVDSTGDVGQYNSLVLVPVRDPRGQVIGQRPLVSYYDATNGDLKAVYCGNDFCSSGNAIHTVDSVGNVGQYTSLEWNPSTDPTISYYDATNKDLKVAVCDPGSPYARIPTTPCQEKQYNTIQTVDALNDVGQYNALAVGSSGPIISYYDASNQDLRIVVQGTGPDLIPPSVTINQHAAQPEVAVSNPVRFTVQFSESVDGFTAADVTLSAKYYRGTTSASGATVSVTGGPSTYEVTVSGLRGRDTLTATVAAGAAKDAAGNDSYASTSTDNSVTLNLP